MVQFYDHLWVGKKASLVEEELRSAVRNGSTLLGGYYLVLSETEGRIMEIRPCREGISSGTRDEKLLVIGLAYTKREANNVAAGIIDTLHKTTGGFDLAGYLREMR